jgi:hypothetical protein
MIRFALLSVLLFQGAVVFCQSTATPTASPQVPGKRSEVNRPFDFGNSRSGPTVARPPFKAFNCQDPKDTRNKASTPIDFDHLFDAPCTDLKSHVELFARNENLLSPSPLVVRPPLKREPIPTQWPNAKVERIPTHWPNLKLRPVDGGSFGAVPAAGGAK